MESGSAYWKAQPAVSGGRSGVGPGVESTPCSPAGTQVRGLMVRRRWAAVVGLVACLLLLQLVVPGLAGEGRAAVVAAVESDAAWSAGAEGAREAEEPCPCEKEPSGRQPAARTPRAAVGAAGVSPAVTGASVPDRDGPDLRAAGAGPCPGAVGSAPSAARLQTFRC
ncbi:hypothetical protein GCM10017668_67560 [Streptomyces tuirus]|uniref:Uncharacterized protein n=1 Tax=Streptomyces tuirus TaxID=68278 RepID=A0A7G1NNR7_9ACTN|nr:hypothetical protein GCM10017668_67560 [Streptomyces tuirus]